jgi:hypothetical protein
MRIIWSRFLRICGEEGSGVRGKSAAADLVLFFTIPCLSGIRWGVMCGNDYGLLLTPRPPSPRKFGENVMKKEEPQDPN